MIEKTDKGQCFLDDVRKTLDAATDSLDAPTQTKLTQMRSRALEAGEKPRSRWLVWPAGAVLATAILLYLVIPQYESKPLVASEVSALSDMEFVSSREGLEFYRDLDFYYWLSMEN